VHTSIVTCALEKGSDSARVLAKGIERLDDHLGLIRVNFESKKGDQEGKNAPKTRMKDRLDTRTGRPQFVRREERPLQGNMRPSSCTQWLREVQKEPLRAVIKGRRTKPVKVVRQRTDTHKDKSYLGTIIRILYSV
jgi:hypothetical protein